MKFSNHINPVFITVFWNLIGIAAFVGIESWLLYQPGRKFITKIQVPFYATCILFYWFACYALLPAIYKRFRSFLIRAGLVLALLLVYTFLYAILNTSLLSYIIGKWVFRVTVADIRACLDRCATVLTIAVGVSIYNEYKRKRKAAREFERQKQAIEFRLRQVEQTASGMQLNTHFLFNALTAIYAKSIHDPAGTAESVLLLTDMLDYGLSAAEFNSMVTVSDEIKIIKAYIHLNQMTSVKQLAILFTAVTDDDQTLIAPFLFQPFIENMFRYGDLSDNSAPGTIQLNVNSRELHFRASNQIGKSAPLKSHGLGIQNVKQRLESRYHNSYRLIIARENGLYNIDLFIML